MKLSLISSLAAALLCVSSLVSSCQASSSPSTETVRLRVDVDRDILPAGRSDRAIVKISLEGLRRSTHDRRPPVNLALVIDRSGSMGGEKIVRAREAAIEAVRMLSPDDIVSVVAFENTAQTLVPAQRVGDGRRIEAAIRGITPGGGTAIYDGVSQGAGEVRRHLEDGRYINRVILLSDGLANVGPSSPDQLGRLGTQLMGEGISVTTIGLGLGFNEDLMSRLARCSDGNTYFVEASSDLPRIFTAELGDVLNVVARRVVIEVDFPAGFRPLAFVGRDGTIRGQRAELTLNQLYGGQEKFALVEVEVAPGSPGVEREIASARVSFEDAVDQKSASLTAKRNVQFSASAEKVRASADQQVQADYAANVIAEAKDQAIALVDSNRRDEAAGLLRRKTEELRQMGENYGNSAVQAAAASVAPEADRLAKEGLDNAQRKSYRNSSDMIVNQQSNGASSR